METIKLNLIPSGVNPTCHCSQYDNGRVIRIELFDGLTPYTLKSGDVVTLNVRKPDNTIVTTTLSTTQGNKYVDLVTTEQICACVGYNLCDLTITNGSVVIGTLNFIMAVERDVLADGIPSQSVIEDLDELVQEAVGDNYYNKTETDTLLDAKADKSTTYTKSEVNAALALKANSSDVYTTSQVDNLLSEKADASAVATALDGKADVDSVYTKSETDNLLNAKADKATTYTKTETDTALALKADKATTYTKTETDTLLNAKANSADVYTKAQVDTALEGKADVDGEYKLMTVGNAEQLKSTVGEINKTPYNFRTSGGSLDIGDRETDKIIGGTIAFNQLIPTAKIHITQTVSDDVTETKWGSPIGNVGASFVGHIVLAKCILSNPKCLVAWANNNVRFVDRGYGNSESNKSYGIYIPTTLGVGANGTLYFRLISGLSAGTYTADIQLFDLTQMLGSTIADYIYSLEQGQAGAGVAWFKKLFPKPYYAYNAGELMSVKTSAHNMTGFNQWDEQWELGSIDADGNPISGNTTIRSKNLIKVLPNTTYYFLGASYNGYIYGYDANGNFSGWGTGAINNNTFTTDSNTYFIRFRMASGYGTTYKNDICINISWDGERDGEYEPYELNSYALDSDLELRGIPKLDTNNNLYYDGDIYESSGDVTRRYGIVNLGSLNWSRFQQGSIYLFMATITDMANNFSYSSQDPNFVGMPYAYKGVNIGWGSMDEDTYGVNLNDIRLRDDSYTTASALKTALSGKYIIYPLATPTTEQADAYQNPQIVNDFGTEEYVDTRSVAIPVGHETFYQANLKAKLEMAPDAPENNGDYLMRHNNGENTYIPYTSPIPSNPTEDGTYTLKVTVSGGTPSLTWVQDT